MASSSEALSSKELLEAQTHLWNHIFSFINALSLKCAVELSIPDAVHSHGKPITLAELAAALSIPPIRIPNFQRLMTLLVHNGYFTQNEDVISLTANSACLVKDKATSIAPFVGLILSEPVFDAWQTLPAWFRSEQPSTAFEMRHQMYIWEVASKMPDFGQKLRDALESDSALVAQGFIEHYGHILNGVKSLVEVAGRTSGLALAVAKAFPQIKCTVLDVAPIIDTIDRNDLVEYVAGDMFEYIPPADALILKWVLMTWSDEECVKILKRCREAVPTKANGGKVIIIEKVIDTGSGDVHPKLTETQLFYDLSMLVHTTGKVRTEAEWKKLFTEAGFKEFNIIQAALGMRCIIVLYH